MNEMPYSRTLRVGVVSPDPYLKKIIKQGLEGFSVGFAEFGIEVDFSLHLFSEDPTFREACASSASVDLVVMDGRSMDDSYAFVLDDVKALEDASQLLLVVSDAGDEAAEKAMNSGACCLIESPVTPHEICCAVERAAKASLRVRKKTTEVFDGIREGEDEPDEVDLTFTFTSLLAHELKAPLNVIEGYADILANRLHGDAASDYLGLAKRIETRTDGMRKLIGDLLDFTRLERGEKTRTLCTVNVKEMVDRSFACHHGIAAKKSVSLCFEGDESVCMVADVDEMSMLLNNLVGNAVKYNREGGAVVVSVRLSPESLTLMVSDTGIGIPEQHQSTVFDEFFRVRNPATREIEGTGLGLAIAKRVLDEYDATISVDSVVGEGSVFTINFPIILPVKREQKKEGGVDGKEARFACGR